MGRLETVTTVSHDDLIPCEAVIVLEAYAPPARASSIQGLLACRPARDLHSCLARIMRPVLGDACWAAVMALANEWLQCAVCGDSPARPGLSAISRCGNATTGMCGVCCVESVSESEGPARKRVRAHT